MRKKLEGFHYLTMDDLEADFEQVSSLTQFYLTFTLLFIFTIKIIAFPGVKSMIPQRRLSSVPINDFFHPPNSLPKLQKTTEQFFNPPRGAEYKTFELQDSGPP